MRRLPAPGGYPPARPPARILGAPAGVWLPVLLAAATLVLLFGLLGPGGGPGGAGFFGLGGGDGATAARRGGRAPGLDDADGPATRSRRDRRPSSDRSRSGRRSLTSIAAREARRAARAARAGQTLRARSGAALSRLRSAPDDDDDDDDDLDWTRGDEDLDPELDPDDDDSADLDADDDDSADADDDDSAFGDDDDSAFGDDDDSAGDDDDSAAPWDDFLDRTYCLDWARADIVQPPRIDDLLDLTGAQLRDYSVLAMPTDVDFATGEIFFVGAPGQLGNCNQDTRWPTADLPDRRGVSLYSEPDFEVVTSFFQLPVTLPALTIYQLRITGLFTEDAGAIVDSTLQGRLDVTAWEELACNLEGWSCYACGAGLRSTCVDLAVANAVWNDSGNPAGIVPVGR